MKADRQGQPPSECRARGTAPPPPWGRLPRFTSINTHTRPSRSGACPSSQVRSEWAHALGTRLRVFHRCCTPFTCPPQRARPGGHLASWDRETASLGHSQMETHAAPLGAAGPLGGVRLLGATGKLWGPHGPPQWHVAGTSSGSGAMAVCVRRRRCCGVGSGPEILRVSLGARLEEAERSGSP